jgi:hypothetical protein
MRPVWWNEGLGRVLIPAIEPQRRNVEKFHFNPRWPQQRAQEILNLLAYLIRHETASGNKH